MPREGGAPTLGMNFLEIFRPPAQHTGGKRHLSRDPGLSLSLVAQSRIGLSEDEQCQRDRRGV
jgi:hypothetical protein